MTIFYKKEQQDLISQPNETGQVCKRLDSTISNKESGICIMLVAPVLPFITIIIIIIIIITIIIIIIIILIQRNF